MSDTSETTEDAISKDLGLHPVSNSDDSPSENEEAETSEGRIRKAVALLLARKIDTEILHLYSDESLKLMHLRHATSDEGQGCHIWLLFKRAPELRPYYATIKSWCESNDLTWQDKIHDGDRYMSIRLDPYVYEITQTILSANDRVFRVKSIYTGSKDVSLNFALSDWNHPYLFAFFGMACVVSLGLLPLYEAFRLPYFDKPSIYALDWPEIFLFILIFIGIFSIRFINRKKRDKNPQSKYKVILGRTVLCLIAALAFFTY